MPREGQVELELKNHGYFRKIHEEGIRVQYLSEALKRELMLYRIYEHIPCRDVELYDLLERYI